MVIKSTLDKDSTSTLQHLKDKLHIRPAKHRVGCSRVHYWKTCIY